ncbi:MAG: fibronectin type III domain-containing protein [Polyangia bacterium]
MKPDESKSVPLAGGERVSETDRRHQLEKAGARCLFGRLVLALAAALAWTPGAAHGTTLTASDFALSVYASAGTSSLTLDSSNLGGFFNPHECLCPDTITATVQMTSAGQTDVGSSTITVSFYLGADCSTSASSASCGSLGSQIALTTSQSAQATFAGSQVFESAAGSATVDCGNLTAGATTLWAFITQDGTTLSFSLSQELPVVSTTVAAPIAVTALPSNDGILVGWTPPADTSQVAGYQVLCLPRPATASAAAYDTCGTSGGTGSTVLTASDYTEVCSAEVSATETSVRLAGLTNGTSYTVAVISIDQSGGISALSPQATAIPQPTLGFFDKYQQEGGAASGCTLSPHSGRAGLLWIALAAALVVALGRGPRRKSRRGAAGATRALVLLLAFSATAHAQIAVDHQDADWPSESRVSPLPQIPDWGVEIGVSLYRPAVDSEFSNGAHPFAETFGSGRHLLSEAEVDRYLYRRYGTWGVGLRGGYYKVTGAAFLADGTRSGDETALSLIPFALSLVYKADRIRGLKQVPLIPYAKIGLDGVAWTATNTGGSPSHSGFTPGWHTAAGVALGLNFLGMGTLNPGALADPCALFFEWDYAAINGLGFSKTLHVGDSTWFAGVTFDL